MNTLIRICALSVLLPALAVAADPVSIAWKDLVPASEIDDPLETLTEDQYWDLAFVAEVRTKGTDSGRFSEQDLVDAVEAEKRLGDAGIEIDYLLSRLDEMLAAQQVLANTMVTEWDQQQIRMPGFLLPLEFEGTLVTEFLLVPYVGACIHTPPPPPNQIVHVSSEAGYESEGLFVPVWVSGKMTVGRSTQELYLIDGVSDVDVGYSLNAESITPYEE